MLRSTPGRLLCAALITACGLASAQTGDLIGPYQLYEDARTRGDFAAAAGFALQSLEATERQSGQDSTDYAEALERLGDAYKDAASLEQAVYYKGLALQARESLLGDDHPDLLDLLLSIAEVQQARHDYAGAQASLERALRIQEAVYGELNQMTIATMQLLADVYVARDDAQAAEAMSARIGSLTEVTRSFDPMADDTRRYDASDGYATVRVFYGTNRSRTGKERPTSFYGKGRGELELGYVDVSIPETHKYGALESQSPFAVFSYFLGEEAKQKKYVLLQSVRPLDEETFYDTLQDHIENESASDDVFVFVHGFNVTFTDAARRAAQLAYDLDFDGTPMMYSWPSQASTAAYTVDEAVVRPSGRKFAELLDGLVAETGAERIHLIAHSMGNRAMIEALQAYVVKNGVEASRNTFDQVVFTAPDVDRDYFIEVMETIGEVAQRTTLYASENDVALRSSRLLHGAPRAGLAGDAIVTLPGLDTIDMSGVEADILGHSYFAASEGAIYDLFRLFWLGDPPPDRCGMNRQQTSGSGFWIFEVDNCRGNELLTAGVLLKRFGAAARERIERRMNGLTEPDQETEKQEWSRILDKLDTLISPGL